MRPGVEVHFKFKRLLKVLKVPLWQGVGLLESLWQFTAQHCPDGDLSKYSHEEICETMEYKKDPKEFFDALVDCGWLDLGKNGYKVHDWMDHCPDYVKKKIKRIEKSQVKHDVTGESQSVTGQRRTTADNGGLYSVAQRSVAQRSAVVARGAERTDERANVAAQPTELASQLATRLEAGRRKTSAAEHAKRTAAIQQRIAELGADVVTGCVTWWIDQGATRHPDQWKRILAYPDALLPHGDVDRLLMARSDDDGDANEAAPAAEPSCDARNHALWQGLCRSHVETLERYAGQSTLRQDWREQIRRMVNARGYDAAKRALEHIMRGEATPEIEALKSNRVQLTQSWLEELA